MSVLIKGMEMPHSCIGCRFCEHGSINEWDLYCGIDNKHVGNWDDKHINNGWRRPDCPLVEVKDKPRDSNGRFTNGFNDGWADIESLSGEEWKSIKGYEDRYKVSNMGRVRSRTKILKTSGGSKYVHVILNDGDVDHRKTVSVHRLVAEAFVPNPCPGEFRYINHKDENKRNNRADNLEWCTAKYNLHYGKNAPIHNLKHQLPTIIEAEEGEKA